MSYPPRTDPQQITRIPNYRPGDWVKLARTADHGDREADLSGRVLRVKSLTCAFTSPEQRLAVWRVHFEDGRSVPAGDVERLATEAEILDAHRRRPC